MSIISMKRIALFCCLIGVPMFSWAVDLQSEFNDLFRKGQYGKAEELLILKGVSSKDPEAVMRILESLREFRRRAATDTKQANTAPTSFRYDYHYDDPGYRQWSREGLYWTETHPSGNVKRFITKGTDTVDGALGTVISQVGANNFEVFVCHKGEQHPRIYFRLNRGKWQPLGDMEDVK